MIALCYQCTQPRKVVENGKGDREEGVDDREAPCAASVNASTIPRSIFDGGIALVP